MRINTVNICADGLIEQLAKIDPRTNTAGGPFAATVEEADEIIGNWVRGYAESGAVDVMLYNVNYHVSLLPSQAFDTAWRKTDGTEITRERLESFGHWNSRFVQAHENGIEPFSLALKHTRAHGMSPWFSVRMNEFHYLRWPETSATFWLEHPEYRLAEDKPFDYHHKEVRDYYIRYIEELCEHWDIDGIELDMIRFFEPTAGDEERAILTETVREIRQRVNRIAAGKGRHIQLSARVYGLPEQARLHWCDAALWVREGLVDGLTVTNFHTPCDFNLPIEQWRAEIGHKEGYFLQAGSDLGNFCIPWGHPQTRVLRQDTESMRGLAASAWAHGADGVYVFNINTSYMLDFSCLKGPDAAISGARRHILTPHNPGASYTLPAPLADQWQARELYVGPGGQQAVVRVGLSGAPESLHVRLNGHDCRPLGRMQPLPGEEFDLDVAPNDYARLICIPLTKAAAVLYEFACDNLPAGVACIEFSGAGAEVTWLECHIRN